MTTVGNTNKKRGKYYENQVANIFRKYSGLLKEDCRRASFSGVQKDIEYGDIYFRDFEYMGGFILECKYCKTNGLDGIFPAFNKLYMSYFKEVLRYRDQYIVRYKHVPAYWGIVHSKPYYNNYITLFNMEHYPQYSDTPFIQSQWFEYDDNQFYPTTFVYEDFLKKVFDK